MKFPKVTIAVWTFAVWLMGGAACTGQETAPTGSTGSPPTSAATETVMPTTPATEASVIGESVIEESVIEESVIEESPTLRAATPVSQVTPLQLEPEATATATPVPTSPPPTPIATSDVVAGWLTYVNEFYDYQFSYPPEARIRTQGVTGVPLEDLPEGMTSEAYRQQLEETYPDDLCVTVQVDIGFVVLMPGSIEERRYTIPCGITGVGVYIISGVSETVLIDGVPVEASGSQLRDSAGAWRGEFYIMDPSDSIRIHYYSMEGTGMTDITKEQFLGVKETLLQIVTSFRQN